MNAHAAPHAKDSGTVPVMLLPDKVIEFKLGKAAQEDGNVPDSGSVPLMLNTSTLNTRRFNMPFQASGRGPLRLSAEDTVRTVRFVTAPQEAGKAPVSVGLPQLVP
ncbi:TPA: hypothetical protein ACH3X3_012696 [Trebouxia sp. C0006]